MNALKFDGDFPASNRGQWLRSVEKAIKGADFEKTLVSKTYDDIRVEPLYQQARGAEPILTGDARPWRIDQRIDLPEPAAANAQLHEDATGGTDGFVLVGSEAPSSRGFGLSLKKPGSVEQVLKGFRPERMHLRIDAGPSSLAFAENIFTLIERQGMEASNLVLDIGCDPIGSLASDGFAHEPPEQTLHHCADLFTTAGKRGFDARIFLADGRPYHEAGASEAQELAAILATALFYFRYFSSHGIDLDAARKSLSFLLVADADEFLTIAKFRALRRLWQRVEQACDMPPHPIRIHAETAWRMMTRYDPWTNLLRSTTAVFSAATGGADVISVLPFTNALGLPDSSARRIARNTQSILLHESNLWRVADPAAGAGGFEELTSQLCNTAWKLFQDIEREGGIASSLEQGHLQSRIAKARQERQSDIFTKRRAITGVSEFPDIGAVPVSVLLPFREQPSPDSYVKTTIIPALPSQRDAEAFERLRDKIEAHAVKTGARPKIFIAQIGDPSSLAVRTGYACNFFEVAGIEAIATGEPTTHETLRAAFVESGATIACLISADENCYSLKQAALAALNETDCRFVFVATEKAVGDAPWMLPGFIGTIFPGCNAISALKRAVVSITMAADGFNQKQPENGSH